MHTKKTALKLLEKEIGPTTFGHLLVAARGILNLTQEKMGKKLGVSRSVVCDIEKGRYLVSLKLAIKIAKKSGIPEVTAVRLCLQDQLRRDKIKMKIMGLKSAA